MVRYIGPRIRIIRRLGLLPGLTRKGTKNRINSPGQHGKPMILKKRRSSLSDDYKERLLEKQKLRFNYGVTEKQLVAYYQKSKRSKGSTGLALLEILESRLDCIVYRLGFAPTIPAARQIVNHGHILVNNKLVNIPGFLCQKGDTITIKSNSKSQNLIVRNFTTQNQRRTLIQRRMKRVNFRKFRFSSLLPTHLEVDNNEFIGRVLSNVKRTEVLIRINELKVIEYYSR